MSQQDEDGTDTHVKDKGLVQFAAGPPGPACSRPSSAAQSCLISPGSTESMREHSPAYLEVPVWGAFPTAPLPPSAGLLGRALWPPSRCPLVGHRPWRAARP